MRRGILYSPDRGYYRHGDASAVEVALQAESCAADTTSCTERQFLILQGCEYKHSGGGQRPAQIARALARLGRSTALYSSVESGRYVEDGVLVIGGVGCRPLEDEFPASRTTVIVTLPTLFRNVRPLVDRGAALVYDMIDNWQGFVLGQDLHTYQGEAEREVVGAARLVTVSAPELAEHAKALGAKRVVTILNGGPDDPLPASVPPPDMALGPIRVVYVGALFGSWMDWELLARVGNEPDFALTVIGNVSGDHEGRGLHLIGERAQADAYRYLAAADVGIVPFRDREICRYAHPIKECDYSAAGLWTVTTPEVEPLANRPFCLTADREEFCEAVREAARLRETDPPTPEWVRENSWAQRARAFIDVDRELAVAPPIRSWTYREQRVAYGEERMRVDWQAPAACNMVPPCPGCCTLDERKGKSPLGCEPDALLQGFLWLAETYGPLLVCGGFGEAFSDPAATEIIGHLARRNIVDLSSNLLMDVAALDRMPRNGNLGIASSFHPHAWGSIEEFLVKRQAFADAGHRMGWVGIYGYPTDMPYLKEWQSKCAEAGIHCNLIPYSGQYNGAWYPDAYTEEEWPLFQASALDGGYREECPAIMKSGGPGKGALCWAGTPRSIFVAHDGTIWRCGSDRAVLGNLCEKRFDPRGEPTPCPIGICRCADLWKFIELGVVNDGG